MQYKRNGQGKGTNKKKYQHQKTSEYTNNTHQKKEGHKYTEKKSQFRVVIYQFMLLSLKIGAEMVAGTTFLLWLMTGLVLESY